MRIAIALILLLAAPAHADISKLGGYQLGQKLAKLKLKKTKLFGCKGSLLVQVSEKKVSEVSFAPHACAIKPDTITAQMGVQPITNHAGDQLWEGAKASIILTADVDGGGQSLMLVAPGGGSKRVCWPDDGFAPFYAGWQKAVAAGKLDGYENPASNGLEWSDVLGDDEKAIVAGTLAPTCDIETGWWTMKLVTGTLTAQQMADGSWMWTALDQAD